MNFSLTNTENIVFVYFCFNKYYNGHKEKRIVDEVLRLNSQNVKLHYDRLFTCREAYKQCPHSRCKNSD